MKRTITLICAAMLLCSLCFGASADAAFSHGTVEGNTYACAGFGIGCRLDEGWVIASDEELAQLAGEALGSIYDSDLSWLIDRNGCFYDMVASRQTPSTYESLNFCIQKYDSAMQDLYDRTHLEDEFISRMIDASEAGGYFDAILDLLGLENGYVFKDYVMFCGKQVPCIRAGGMCSSVPYYETIVFAVSDEYFGAITATSLMTDTTAETLASFMPLYVNA